jgi:hypothetical protein
VRCKLLERKMKFNICYLILLILFSFALGSESLKENREKNKISVSLGYNFLRGSGGIESKEISLDYSLNGNLKVGTTLQYVDRVFYFNNVEYPLCPSISCTRTSSLKPLTGKVFINYFPFSGAFHLVAAIGKLPDYSKKTIVSGQSPLSLEEPDYDRVYDQAITYTVDTAHNYYANYGFGWRWDLINGLLFGFDFGLAKEINRRRDIYIYADSRGLIDNRNIPTQRDILFYQAITRSYGTDKGYGSINIYAGISF